MKKYDSYKDCGIEWIGEIPSHWKVKRGDVVFKLKKFLIKKDDLNGLDVYHYSIPAVQEFGQSVMEEGFSIDSDKFIIEGEEILFSKLNPRKGTLVLSTKHEKLAVASTEFVILEPLKENLKYCYFLLSSEGFKSYISSLVESATKSHQRANPSDIYKAKLVLPPLSEQTAIATYLDHKTAEIDELIADKKCLLELYEEEKTAIINQAVTKGLDPEVPMKDSGIEWLGEIPEHWEVKRLKYVAEMQGGFAFSSGDFVQNGVQLIKISNLYNNDLHLERQPTFLPEEFIHSHSDWVIKNGDILMSMTGTLGKRDYGFAILIENMNDVLMLNQRVSKIHNIDSINSRFLIHCLRSEYFLNNLFVLPAGTKQGNFSNDNVLNLKIAFPAQAKEQQSIVHHIQTECNRINTQVRRTKKLIDLLAEYRTALISEVVMGKVKVTE